MMEIIEGQTIRIPEENWAKYAQICNDKGLHLVRVGDRLFVPTKDTSGVDTTELNSERDWFETYYAQHEQKYRRFIDLGINCDDGSDPHEKLKALQLEAEEKRKKIKNLENFLKNA